MIVCGRPLQFGDREQIEALKRLEVEAQPKRLFAVTVRYDQPVTRRIVVPAVNSERAEEVVALYLPEGSFFEVQAVEDTGQLAIEGDAKTLTMFGTRAADATAIRGADSHPADVRLG